jgi:CDP-6-deoxy-D-xylo-4-hexulose-3-dehydrase
MSSEKTVAAGREAVFDEVRRYYKEAFAARPFVAGETIIPPSGKVFDERELLSLVDSSLDFWLTTGRFADRFEKKLGKFLGLPHAALVNSGSSANLVAVSTLFSHTLGDKRVKAGDEVVTTGASFPTTVNPIIQNGAVPVLVDAHAPTYNADVRELEAAITPKTRAIVLAHTLGNPFDLGAVMKLAEKHGLWVVEDCCDALGAKYDGTLVSNFGDLATFSFYPAHHITMGEGGVVATRSARLNKVALSIRDWGRDCWCDPGRDNTCGRRFDHQLGELPYGYDHKYIYSHVGYNLKATDMQAAVGVAQLDRLEEFIAARKRNFAALREGLKPFEEHLILPEATPKSDPSWFGFPITVRESAPFKREKLTAFLEAGRIGTRLLFSGNITRQPYFKDVPHRKVSALAGCDRIMRGTFWIGVFPGITPAMTDYMVGRFADFFTAL